MKAARMSNRAISAPEMSGAMPKAMAGPTLKTRVKARTRCSPACAARCAWVRGKAISPMALPITIGASMVQWVANAAVIIR